MFVLVTSQQQYPASRSSATRLSPAAIAGIGVGGVAIIVLLIMVAVVIVGFFVRHRTHKNRTISYAAKGTG